MNRLRIIPLILVLLYSCNVSKEPIGELEYNRESKEQYECMFIKTSPREAMLNQT
jgi:hypothetical protein